MKNLNIKLYSFEELSEDSQKSYVSKNFEKITDDALYGVNYDREETLEAFKKLFDIESLRYEVNSFSWAYNFKLNEYACGLRIMDGFLDCREPEDITGKYLRRFINKIYDKIISPSYYYKSLKKSRKSAVIFHRGDAPLTGICFDEDIISPIWEIYNKPIPKDYSLNNLIDDCLDNFFRSWRKDFEYYEDTQNLIEFMKESLEPDEEKFLADGTPAPAFLIA